MNTAKLLSKLNKLKSYKDLSPQDHTQVKKVKDNPTQKVNPFTAANNDIKRSYETGPGKVISDIFGIGQFHGASNPATTAQQKNIEIEKGILQKFANLHKGAKTKFPIGPYVSPTESTATPPGTRKPTTPLKSTGSIPTPPSPPKGTSAPPGATSTPTAPPMPATPSVIPTPVISTETKPGSVTPPEDYSNRQRLLGKMLKARKKDTMVVPSSTEKPAEPPASKITKQETSTKIAENNQKDSTPDIKTPVEQAKVESKTPTKETKNVKVKELEPVTNAAPEVPANPAPKTTPSKKSRRGAISIDKSSTLYNKPTEG